MRQSQKSNFKTGFKLAPLLWLILLLPACDFKDYQEYENDNNEWERKKRAAANSHKIPYGEYFQKEVVNPDTGSRLRFMKPSHFEDVVELEAFEPLTVETNSFSLLQSSPVEYLSRSLKIKFVNFHQSDLPEGAKVVISPAKKASLTSDDIKELYVYAQYTDKDANQVTQLIKVTDPDFDGYLISTKYLGNGYYQLVRVNGGESAILTPQKTAKKPEFTYVTGGDGKTRSPEGSSTKKETAAASEELSSAESLAPPPCTHDKQVGCITTVTYKSSKSFYTNCASSGEEGCKPTARLLLKKNH